ncbi:MAG: ABC transporter permease [Clostridia bacterium]|nr:ABC transporter permease [Clostridia bacterium]
MLKSIHKSLVMFRECVRMSLSNILANRVRSFLTVLGILIGVTAVIALITTISGVSGSLSSSFSSMGAGTLMVSVTGSDLKSGMTADDLTELTAMDEVDGLTPSVSLSARVSRGGSYETNISVSGKNAYYFRTNENLLTRGRALNAVDEAQTSFVCWISPDMVESFFYGVDPIGESLYINGVPFLVSGLLSEDGDASMASMMSGSADILIPYTTALKMNNTSDVTSFTVYLADGVDSETAADSIEASMDAMFSFEENCFTVTTMSGIEDTMEEMLSMMTALLAGIASIALVVGGIGIMNMMLTSVTERTTEIGLKKALGALPWQIQLQFLMESFLLSLIGGLAGVVLGLTLSFAMCKAMGTQFALSVGAIALGVGFSAAVGVLFGWAPARKASRLNPIDALRSV